MLQLRVVMTILHFVVGNKSKCNFGSYRPLGGGEGGAIICAEVNATIKSCYDLYTFCSWEVLFTL